MKQLYEEIDALVKVRKDEGHGEDVVEMLRRAFSLLDQLDVGRPDSGFSEQFDRTGAYTPVDSGVFLNRHGGEDPNLETPHLYYNTAGRYSKILIGIRR